MLQAIRAPFTEGILVTGMLVTTLVPTVIHVGVGLGHICAAFLPDCRSAASLINDDMSVGEKQRVAAVLVYRKLCWIPGMALAVIGTVWVFFLLSLVVGPVAQTLGLVAECAASLVNGECTWPVVPTPPLPAQSPLRA